MNIMGLTFAEFAHSAVLYSMYGAAAYLMVFVAPAYNHVMRQLLLSTALLSAIFWSREPSGLSDILRCLTGFAGFIVLALVFAAFDARRYRRQAAAGVLAQAARRVEPPPVVKLSNPTASADTDRSEFKGLLS